MNRLFLLPLFTAAALTACGSSNSADSKADADSAADSTAVEAAAVTADSAEAFSIEIDSLEVVTTPSGLKYQVVKQGTGAKPTPADNVTVVYTGRFTDGRVFDSNADAEPITFPLNGLIKGWIEGLQMMPVGSTYRFIIPPELAYGDQGYPGYIPPGATLVFDITLEGIEK